MKEKFNKKTKKDAEFLDTIERLKKAYLSKKMVGIIVHEGDILTLYSSLWKHCGCFAVISLINKHLMRNYKRLSLSKKKKFTKQVIELMEENKKVLKIV